MEKFKTRIVRWLTFCFIVSLGSTVVAQAQYRSAFAYAYNMNRVAVATMGNDYLQGSPSYLGSH